MTRVVVVGAGIGGLVTAAMLARAGLDVTVLEAHIYPGGCAGTFYHQGYRFDAGATLPAGFEPGGVMARLGEDLGIDWAAQPAGEVMVVHLADGAQVTQYADPAAWQAARAGAFGPAGEPFWRWQEATADALWQVARQGVPWPPGDVGELSALARSGLRLASAAPQRAPGLARDAFRSLAAHLPRGASSARLRQFVDAQLLISAQVTSSRANALYGAAALDLPRRGVAHLPGGMGSIGVHLAEALQRQGGRVLYRQRVTRVTREPGQGWRLETHRGAAFAADVVVFNLPPWDAEALLDAGASGASEVPGGPASRPDRAAHAAYGRVPADGWGAFILYAGFAAGSVPAGFPLHHQIIMREPLGEGNSVFLSLSLPGDTSRAPAGRRAATLSTHTALQPWWDLYERDRPAYEARKSEWAERVWAAAERVLPGARPAADLALPGTPVTFARFTHRSLGWVGGFPQSSLWRSQRPRLGHGLWLVGDSVFPGQSALAVTLGGLRVARAVLTEGEGARTARRSYVWRPRWPRPAEDCGA